MKIEAFEEAVDITRRSYEENGYCQLRRRAVGNVIDKIQTKVKSMTVGGILDFDAVCSCLWYEYKDKRSIQSDIRHVSAMIDEAEKTGTTQSRNISAKRKVRKPLPSKLEVVAKEFHTYVCNLYSTDSTIGFFDYAMNIFLSFAALRGVQAIEEVTELVLHDFICLGLLEYSASTKQAILYRVRKFLLRQFLEGRTPYALVSYIDCRVEIPERVVTVLPKEQRDAIATHHEDHAKDWRNKAIALCCMEMGFRISDVLGLSFRNIDWDQKTISIVQKKTGVPLKLPMPETVGCAIARYVLDFRHQSKSSFIFLKIRAPYTRLKVSGRTNILDLIGEASENVPEGANHLLRRTCASSLLESGADVFTISTILGHTDLSSMDPYLSIDCEHMKATPLTDINIGMPEVLA